MDFWAARDGRRRSPPGVPQPGSGREKAPPVWAGGAFLIIYRAGWLTRSYFLSVEFQEFGSNKRAPTGNSLRDKNILLSCNNVAIPLFNFLPSCDMELLNISGIKYANRVPLKLGFSLNDVSINALVPSNIDS